MVSTIFPLAALFSNTVNTRLWKEMEIAEKEGGLPVFDTDIVNSLFCQLLMLLPHSRTKSAQSYDSYPLLKS